MDLVEIGCKNENWFQIDQDGMQWWRFEVTVMKLLVS